MSSNFENSILDKIKELIQYYDLSYILNNIESLIILPTPYRNSKVNQEQFENNKRISVTSQSNSELVYKKLLDEARIRKSIFGYIRRYYPNFCQSMRKKFSSEEYEEYLSLLKDCSKDITTLIKSFRNRGNDYSELLMNKKDCISNIIDSETTSRLTFLQDSFVLDELNSIDSSSMDSEIQDNIESIRKELNRRISKYHDFQRLYSSKNIIKIKAAESNRKNEERE